METKRQRSNVRRYEFPSSNLYCRLGLGQTGPIVASIDTVNITLLLNICSARILLVLVDVLDTYFYINIVVQKLLRQSDISNW